VLYRAGLHGCRLPRDMNRQHGYMLCSTLHRKAPLPPPLPPPPPTADGRSHPERTPSPPDAPREEPAANRSSRSLILWPFAGFRNATELVGDPFLADLSGGRWWSLAVCVGVCFPKGKSMVIAVVDLLQCV